MGHHLRLYDGVVAISQERAEIYTIHCDQATGWAALRCCASLVIPLPAASQGVP